MSTAKFDMFTLAGDRACEVLVELIAKKILGPKRLSLRQLQELSDEGRKVVGSKHEEISDTEPRYIIDMHLNKALKEAGYVYRFNGYGEVNNPS